MIDAFAFFAIVFTCCAFYIHLRPGHATAQVLTLASCVHQSVSRVRQTRAFQATDSHNPMP